MPQLFYPSHDIALANGVKHFNTPFAARRLEEDLASLAKIWNNGCSSCSMQFPLPWAWDYDTRSLLNKEYGVKMKDLPSDEDLKLLREISSRKTTIEILKRLKVAMPGNFEEIALPEFIETKEELERFFAVNEKVSVFKTLWSSSGRGLARSDVWSDEALRKHVEASIKKQGGIIAEPWYENKTQDIAELFYIGRDGVRFVGFSIFHNDENGTYRYGELMSEELMEVTLPHICQDTRDALLPILEDLFRPFFGKTWEVGFIGIDMFLLSSSVLCLHPCVEMNVRCTMGVVARLFFDQTFGADSNEIGEFYISRALNYEKLKQMDANFLELYGKRYFRLTEITPLTQFMAYAIMS